MQREVDSFLFEIINLSWRKCKRKRACVAKVRNSGEALTNVAIHALLREPFRQLPQCQLNSAYAPFRYRQSPNEKKQTNFCLHASMTQSLPVLFALLVASLNLYSTHIIFSVITREVFFLFSIARFPNFL